MFFECQITKNCQQRVHKGQGTPNYSNKKIWYNSIGNLWLWNPHLYEKNKDIPGTTWLHNITSWSYTVSENAFLLKCRVVVFTLTTIGKQWGFFFFFNININFNHRINRQQELWKEGKRWKSSLAFKTGEYESNNGKMKVQGSWLLS